MVEMGVEWLNCCSNNGRLKKEMERKMDGLVRLKLLKKKRLRHSGFAMNFLFPLHIATLHFEREILCSHQNKRDSPQEEDRTVALLLGTEKKTTTKKKTSQLRCFRLSFGGLPG